MQKKYYPNIEYNRSKRRNFYVTLMLLVVCMGLAIGTMVAIKQFIFAVFFLVILVLMFTLIPSVHKNYPVKADKPHLEVDNKDINLDKVIQNQLKNHTLKEAVKIISKKYNLKRNDVYEKALEIKNKNL